MSTKFQIFRVFFYYNCIFKKIQSFGTVAKIKSDPTHVCVFPLSEKNLQYYHKYKYYNRRHKYFLHFCDDDCRTVQHISKQNIKRLVLLNYARTAEPHSLLYDISGICKR